MSRFVGWLQPLIKSGLTPWSSYMVLTYNLQLRKFADATQGQIAEHKVKVGGGGGIMICLPCEVLPPFPTDYFSFFLHFSTLMPFPPFCSLSIDNPFLQ